MEAAVAPTDLPPVWWRCPAGQRGQLRIPSLTTRAHKTLSNVRCNRQQRVVRRHRAGHGRDRCRYRQERRPSSRRGGRRRRRANMRRGQGAGIEIGAEFCDRVALLLQNADAAIGKAFACQRALAHPFQKAAVVRILHGAELRAYFVKRIPVLRPHRARFRAASAPR
jgi:hypothetical protein